MTIKRVVLILFAITMIISLSSCVSPKEDKVENVYFPYFTKQQITNDFNELLDIMEMNYPHFSTVKRMYGVDKDEITRRYTEILEDHSETFELSEAAGLMFDFVNEFRNVGHLIFYNGAAYEQVGNMLKGFSSQDESIKHLYDTFTGKNTVRSYEYLRKNDIPFNNDRVQTQNKS